MKQFLHDNLALVAGILLPVILMAVFFIAGRIPQSVVADPQYDLIFATNYYEGNSHYPYQIAVENGDLVIHHRKPPDEHTHYQTPTLYRFNHKTLQSEILDINFDNIADGRVLSPAIDALNETMLSDKRVSPDGWEFDYHYRGSGGLFGDLFGFGYRGSGTVLRKDGRLIRLEDEGHYYQGEFIAWVTGEQP